MGRGWPIWAEVCGKHASEMQPSISGMRYGGLETSEARKLKAFSCAQREIGDTLQLRAGASKLRSSTLGATAATYHSPAFSAKCRF
jgi:hypothetical protein